LADLAELGQRALADLAESGQRDFHGYFDVENLSLSYIVYIFKTNISFLYMDSLKKYIENVVVIDVDEEGVNISWCIIDNKALVSDSLVSCRVDDPQTHAKLAAETANRAIGAFGLLRVQNALKGTPLHTLVCTRYRFCIQARCMGVCRGKSLPSLEYASRMLGLHLVSGTLKKQTLMAALIHEVIVH
jgi:hypothetical protein